MRTLNIRGFPLPPSANTLYANQHRGSGGRYKTVEYKKFENEVYAWSLENQHQLRIVRLMVEKLRPQEVLHIDRLFWFKPHKILTKDLRPRINDTSNRLKALDDSFSQLIGLNDTYFWSGSFHKRPILHESHKEGVDLTIRIVDLESIANGQVFADSAEDVINGTLI